MVLQILVGADHCLEIDALEVVCSFLILQLPLHAALDLCSHGLDHNFNFLKNHPMDRHLDYLLLP